MAHATACFPPGSNRNYEIDYFAGAGAGVVVLAAGVADVAAAGVAVELLAAFLVFFTCFFAVGVELSVGVAAACAANDNPAVASVRESPSNIVEIFFMMFCPIPLSRLFSCLYSY